MSFFHQKSGVFVPAWRIIQRRKTLVIEFVSFQDWLIPFKKVGELTLETLGPVMIRGMILQALGGIKPVEKKVGIIISLHYHGENNTYHII